jgi:Holliday junction DNA helicase RuvA
VFLHTHLHVREDALTLYGFATRDERATFEALIGAHRVGPALALAILSVHRPDGLRRALLDDDLDALCLVPGVGRKTAARHAQSSSSPRLERPR